MLGGAEKTFAAGYIEKGLVDGNGLDQRRELLKDLKDLTRDLRIAFHAWLNDDHSRTQAHRAGDRHGAMAAEGSRFVAGSRDNATALRISSDQQGLAAPLGMIKLFNRGEECIHVEVENPSRSRAIHVVHDTTDLAVRHPAVAATQSDVRVRPRMGRCRIAMENWQHARSRKMNSQSRADALAELEPRSVWSYFTEIAAVPRPSKHEERARPYVRGVADRHGLAFKEDQAGNLVVQVPPTAGLAQLPITVLQAHLDMVCEKNGPTQHDFCKRRSKCVALGGRKTYT